MISDWIKTGLMILGFLVTIGIFFFQSFATQREINARFNGIQQQLNGMQRELDEARDHRHRIKTTLTEDIHRVEDKVEQLTQNYIDHLAHHNNPQKQ